MMTGLRAAGVIVTAATWASGTAGAGLPAPVATADPAAATQNGDRDDELHGAAAIYARAVEAMEVNPPSGTSIAYRPYPPFGDEWRAMAAAAWERNREARRIAREARAFDTADWPEQPAWTEGVRHGGSAYNAMRHLANELGDATWYAHVYAGDDRETLELVRDMRHMARLLATEPREDRLIRWLVSIGLEAHAVYRLNVVAPGLRITPGGDDEAAVSVQQVRDVIADLLDSPDEQAAVEEAYGDRPAEDADAAADDAADEPPLRQGVRPAERATGDRDRFRTTLRRTSAERMLTAASLAAQLHRVEHGRWPTTPDELAAYLPAGLPVDPFGDGQETIGYVLIGRGLPDGSDRPLVYHRGTIDGRFADEANAAESMFYRTDTPQYGFYVDTPTGERRNEDEFGGQFRDVARWSPPADVTPPVAVRPLE